VIAVDSPQEAIKGADILSSCTDSMNPVYDAEWIEPGMHVTNLGRREMPDASSEKFDVVIRQGTAGLQMKMSERFQAERGLSPAAYIGGTVEEMKRIPEKNPEPGFGGDDPDFNDRGKGGTYPDFADLVSGKAEGRTSDDQVTFYRNVGNQGLQFSSVGQVVYRKAKTQKLGQEIPTDWARYPRLTYQHARDRNHVQIYRSRRRTLFRASTIGRVLPRQFRLRGIFPP